MDSKMIKDHFNTISCEYDYWKKKNSYYYTQLKIFYRRHIPPGKKVLEIGCATGDILASVTPQIGVGVDISKKMAVCAQTKHTHLKFLCSDAQQPALKHEFDFVIMCDLLDHIPDIWKVLKEADALVRDGGSLIINTVNPLWAMLLGILETLKLKMPEGPHNFLYLEDVSALVELFNFKVEKKGYFVTLPVRIPGISALLNTCIPHIPLLRNLCMCHYLVAKKDITIERPVRKLGVSIVIPCFNEEDNVALCASRIPSMAHFQEIIFVNDGSMDRTEDKIRELMKNDTRIKLISYHPCQGKRHAVQRGFEAAEGDVLIILDADISVLPEDLPKFYATLAQDKADFVNGTRMVYPVRRSMNTLNLIGNKMFSLIFSWLLGQRITDTLCGTKALLKKDYAQIKSASRSDTWGDFDLLFGAAKLSLRIKEIPVRYQFRMFGYSKMKPFKHGAMLMVSALKGFKEMKIGPLFKRR